MCPPFVALEIGHLEFQHLHSFAALAQEGGDIQVGLLEVGDHGVAHVVDFDDFADADETPADEDATNDGPEDCSRDDTRGSSCDSITMRGDSGTESKSSAPAIDGESGGLGTCGAGGLRLGIRWR